MWHIAGHADEIPEAGDYKVWERFGQSVVIARQPDGDIEARMTAGQLLKGFGEGAPTTLNIPYDVARKMIVENDQNAAMQAFMGGQIQVEGDMTQIMAMQAAGPPSPESVQVAERIRAMTG